MRAMAPEHGAGAEGVLREATPSELTRVEGGRINLGRFGPPRPLPLVGPDGDPVAVYVDGIRVSRY
jgi:hypothetical protein